MATFHSGSEGQTQKLQALRRRQKRLAFRAVIVPPVCWGICAASAPWWFPPLKAMLGVRFDAQTQGWILLVLMLLMISATFTSTIITHFETLLSGAVLLTAFIPMLMDSAGNSGSQTSVTVIRNLALGEIELRDWPHVLAKEIGVAVVSGAALALVNFLRIIIFTSTSMMIAAVVSVTLFCTVIIAMIVGCLLPIGAKKLGFDPAVMASPMITTIVDACSLMIYFLIATSMLGL